VVVENVFGILKKTFKELLHKLDLSVTFLLDVFTYYCLLHNLLRIEDDASIEHLMRIIELEANSLHENQLVNIAQDEPTNQQLDGEERFREKIWRQLTHYIGRQRSFT
jgi:hypothetical protein